MTAVCTTLHVPKESSGNITSTEMIFSRWVDYNHSYYMKLTCDWYSQRRISDRQASRFHCRALYVYSIPGLSSLTHDGFDADKLSQILGCGSTGVVWKARDTVSRKCVAIKLTHPWIPNNEDACNDEYKFSEVLEGVTGPDVQ